MNSKLVLSTILLVAFACLVKETDGLRCYYCDSCYSLFNSTDASIIECNGSCSVAKNSKVLKRGCSDATVELCVSGSHDGIPAKGCTCISNLCNGGCIGDLCNGGLMYGLSHILCVLSFVLMVVIAKFW